MGRRLSVALALVLVSLPAGVVPLHLHAYSDHDHPEHRHGLAVHQHAQSHHVHAVESVEGTPQPPVEIEPCKPNAHVVSIALCAESVSSLEMSVTHLAIAVANTRPSSSHERLGIVDERGHGPPGTVCTAPRAPPALNHT